VSVEPVAYPRRLCHQILARLEQEMQLARPIGQSDRWQVWFTGRDPGDRKGIARVALARPTRPLALGTTEVRRHLAHGEPGALGRPRERCPEGG
jgi:hypothetical protein